MKTITFYSYKGGVGRSLALSDMATRLSELGQKVCVIDFDLDAPGLRFKFKNYTFPDITKGIVDYIYEFSANGTIGNISDYAVEAESANHYFENITFISAGNIHSDDYWKKLSMIRWYELFYSEEPQGVEFFLDLKAQIEEQFNPDFLLIDSRTGITDISGVTLRLLADQVVVLGINNQENLFGCQKIIKSLLNPKNNLFGKALPVNFVLTRVAYNKFDKEKEREVIDYEKEYIIVEKIRSDFKEILNVEQFDVSIIHSDRNIEQEEGQLQGSLYENQPGSVSKDYLQLFEKLTYDILNLDERFLTSRKAEIEYVKSFNEDNQNAKLSLLNKAISIDNTKYIYYLERGVVNFYLGKIDESLNDHLNALELSPYNSHVNNNLGKIYFTLKNHETALAYFKKAGNNNIDALMNKGVIYRRTNRFNDALQTYNEALLKSPFNDKLLNARADVHRMLGNFNEALIDITKAIELNSNAPLYFATLSEVYSDLGKTDEFYLNFSIALSKGLKVDDLNAAFDVYQKYLLDERFLTLISKYKIDINDLVNDILF